MWKMGQRATTRSSSQVGDRQLFRSAERKVPRPSFGQKGWALIRKVGTEIHCPSGLAILLLCRAHCFHLDSRAVLELNSVHAHSPPALQPVVGRRPSG